MKILIAMLATLPILALKGFVLLKIWVWFNLGDFFNFNEMTLTTAMIIVLVVALLTNKHRPFDDEDNIEFWSRLLYPVVLSLEVLLFGYLITLI